MDLPKRNYKGIKLGIYIAVLSYVTLTWLRPKSSPVISIRSGKVQGFVSTSRSGRPFYEFRGIPYAEPPIGELRFEPPVRVNPWDSTLQTTKFGASCFHYDFFFTGRFIGEESCLFINVMTPKVKLEKKVQRRLLPVIVFIHGGAYNAGEAKLHKGRFFMDEDVVLVVPNYRLGILGFLSTNDDVIKGNMGLKDVILALRWVQENIQAFGGDPSQVTIMGESAGGGTVQMLMLSPLAKGLFHRGISMSCNAISDIWQFSRNSSEHVELIAKETRCPYRTTTEFVQCLKAKSIEELGKFRVTPDYQELFHDHHSFGPCAENHNGTEYVLNHHTATLLKEGKAPNSVPWMVGVNQNEGLAMLPRTRTFPGFENFLKDEETWDRYINQITWYNKTESPHASSAIRNHYFGNLSLEVTDERAIRGISRIVTDKVFFLPLVESVKYQSRLSPTYVYLYNYRPLLGVYNLLEWSSPLQWIPELSVAFNAVKQLIKALIFRIPLPDYGVAHADELMVLFDMHDIIYYFSTYYDGEMSRLFVKTIADFANTTKDVKFNGLAWPVINASQPLQVMNIDIGPPKISIEPFKERLKFWKQLNIPWT